MMKIAAVAGLVALSSIASAHDPVHTDGGDAAGIEIHEIMPASREIAAGSNLDHWHCGQSIRAFHGR